MDGEGTYDQILVDVTTYVFHYQIDSEQAWQRARLALLDSLGCAMETLALSAECGRIIGPVVPSTIVPHGFHLPGTAYQLDPVKGAFDLGSLIRYLDHNDAYPGREWGHPSDNLGALLAVSDWRSRSPGPADAVRPPPTLRTLLAGLIEAYEIQGCFQIRNAFNRRGLDHTLLVRTAATAVASWLLGLSERQTLAALSHAWQDGACLRTFRQAPNAGPRKGWAAGDACARAVQLALLAQAGQPGAPSVLTDAQWGFYTTLFGGRTFELPRAFGSWVMETVFFKLIPAEGHGIVAIEAAVQLAQTMARQGLSPADHIARVHVGTQALAMSIINKTGRLRNRADRDHCLQYMLAVVLLKGAVIETEDYDDASPWAADERVDALRQKIDMVEDEGFTRDYYDQRVRSGASRVAIVLKDGSALPEVVVEFLVGHPTRKDTVEQVKRKFRRNMGLRFAPEKIEEIMRAVEDDQMRVCDFVDLFDKK
jgi:2-methylcitrate dehydratase